ncbi:transposase [Providencia rettgeri]|nr:transposase [Providencia rettgeri]
MDKNIIKALASELAKNIKNEKDLSEFSSLLKKLTIETVLNAELSEHLGYDKNRPTVPDNSRNGFSQKTLKTENGTLLIEVPEDRQSE